METQDSKELYKDVCESSASSLSSEEDATFILWAYPKLLGFGKEIRWLFSPVTGNKKYPGDLWGVEENGNLIVVETKSLNSKDDPFKDFVNYNKTPVLEDLSKRWNRLLESEKDFISKYEQALVSGDIKPVTHPGVVPYSSKRYATRFWKHVYLEIIREYIVSDESISKTKAFLKKYEKGQSTIYYVGLIALANNKMPKWTNVGKKNYQGLVNTVGEDHVYYRAMSACLKEKSIEIACWSLVTH